MRPENGDREQVLHRNLLLPFNVIPPAQRNQTSGPKDSRNSHAPTTSSNVDLIDEDDGTKEDDDLDDTIILRPEAPVFLPPIQQPTMHPPAEASTYSAMPHPPAAPAEHDTGLHDPELSQSETSGHETECEAAHESVVPNAEETVIHSGRTSQPPPRFQDEQFCCKARLLLSMVNSCNQNVVGNVFRTCLSI